MNDYSKYVKLFVILLAFLIVFLSISSDASKRMKKADEVSDIEKLLKNQELNSSSDFQKVNPAEVPVDDSAYQINTNASAELQQQQADAIDAGMEALNQNNVMGAIDKFKIASQSPNEETRKKALNMLVDCYKQLNEVPQIIGTYNQLLALPNDNEKQSEIYENLGKIYYENGDFGNAIQMYRTSYSLSPKNENAYKICEIYEMTQDYESLKMHLNDYLSKNPLAAPQFERFKSLIESEPAPPVQEETPQSEEP